MPAGWKNFCQVALCLGLAIPGYVIQISIDYSKLDDILSKITAIIPINVGLSILSMFALTPSLSFALAFVLGHTSTLVTFTYISKVG